MAEEGMVVVRSVRVRWAGGPRLTSLVIFTLEGAPPELPCSGGGFGADDWASIRKL